MKPKTLHNAEFSYNLQRVVTWQELLVLRHSSEPSRTWTEMNERQRAVCHETGGGARPARIENHGHYGGFQEKQREETGGQPANRHKAVLPQSYSVVEPFHHRAQLHSSFITDVLPRITEHSPVFLVIIWAKVISHRKLIFFRLGFRSGMQLNSNLQPTEWKMKSLQLLNHRPELPNQNFTISKWHQQRTETLKIIAAQV